MYLAIKILHILAFTSWMAGMFYLPRLFVYHAEMAAGQPHTHETLTIMERKLYKFIMNPAMMVTWATGLYLALLAGVVDIGSDGWLWLKIALVVAMTVQHMAMNRWRMALADGSSVRSGRFFRVMNEAPTLLFIGIVIMVIARPF